jgi:hypothetical protein
MQSVEVEQQAIVELQFADAGWAAPGQLEHGIGAIGMAVDQVVGNLQLAGAAAVQRQAAQRPGIDLGVARAQFAPGDLAVAIGIEAEREIDVAQRDVPLPGDLAALHVEHQIAVAGLVRQSRQREQQNQAAEPGTNPHRRITSAVPQGDTALHNFWSRSRKRASSKPLLVSQSRTGLAAAASPAAIAASSRMRASRGSRCTR